MTKTLFLAATLYFSVGIFTVQAQQTVEEDFAKVEKDAEFVGGQKAWVKFLSKTLNPSVPLNNGAPAGTYTVIVTFIVSKTGLVANIGAETKFGYGMESELKRVIGLSPEWTPAIQNGKPVNAYRRQPITFVVPEDKKKDKGKN